MPYENGFKIAVFKFAVQKLDAAVRCGVYDTVPEIQEFTALKSYSCRTSKIYGAEAVYKGAVFK